ncbi:MAG: hypothetical protein EOP85_10095 [Verrucomicrobiaceae bacterium]|nr:MAG: hypothetical protein EOP85_10095 [Verrucomicrobiaceae bacterium]
MNPTMICCGFLSLLSISCGDFSLSPGYVKRHSPVTTPGVRTCDHRYDLKSKRGVFDLVHSGLSGTRSETYTVRFVNHGKDFKVTRRSEDGWTTIGEGQTVDLWLPPPDTGFQISNQLGGNGVSITEPVRATVTFIGLPCDLAERQLIEAGSGL